MLDLGLMPTWFVHLAAATVAKNGGRGVDQDQQGGKLIVAYLLNMMDTEAAQGVQ
jgi:hypothetical protein